MTNEEAVKILESMKTDLYYSGTDENDIFFGRDIKALNFAIKVLKERQKGEWIVTAEDNDGIHRICCPFCSYEQGSDNACIVTVTFTKFPKFCENCGAKLGGTE